jgi:hypothetical protein
MNIEGVSQIVNTHHKNVALRKKNLVHFILKKMLHTETALSDWKMVS